MKLTFYVILFLAFIPFNIEAQSVLGKWHSIDPDTGAKESIIEVYEKGDKIDGKIIQIL